ncbi:MAG: MBL fold metallo-hydrolase [Spirochaetaceae bacterium]|jgi:glyoxylase-like metal-dependent hydrolase (beta-lactamase superfamily II)|nr:MBL fold metallo-hydrolase [Spirochaetaceae bacterium]
MVLFAYYCPLGFSNCYVAGTELDEAESGGQRPEAFIIDPTQIDEAIINFIEGKHYKLKAALLTHDHPNHASGLRSLMRIYENVEIYAAKPVVQGFKTNMLHDGDIFTAAGFEVEAIAVPGHSADSIIYCVGQHIFTGDSLTAGLLGSTASSYATIKEFSVIQHKIFSLPGNYFVFPAHGPPSTLESERRFSTGANVYQQSLRRPANGSFKLDLLG